MVWVNPETLRLFSPAFGDEFMRRASLQCLEALCVIVGVYESVEVVSQLIM